jgi:hypothetical protein
LIGALLPTGGGIQRANVIGNARTRRAMGSSSTISVLMA